jgi:hypothetical protein
MIQRRFALNFKVQNKLARENGCGIAEYRL